MAVDPTLLLLVAAVTGTSTPEAAGFGAEASAVVESDGRFDVFDPDAVWNYARDPYPPCSMG